MKNFGRRIFIAALAIVMALFCMVNACAEDVSGDNLKIIVDLRNYNGTVSGEWKDSNGNIFSIQSGMRNEILLTTDTRFSKKYKAVITLEDVTSLYDWSVIGAIDGRLKKSATQTEVVSNTVMVERKTGHSSF